MAERCPVCASAATTVFLRRAQVPVHQNSPASSEKEALAARRGDLHMAVCLACSFVFNAAFDPQILSYDERYDNSQAFSEVFSRHMEELADHLVNRRGVQGVNIVEVGCGKGDFLRMLVEKHPRNTGIGFDPSYAGPGEEFAGRLRFERRMFGPGTASPAADVVLCRHVIEHVARPLELLESVRDCLPNARLFFETPCVEWILGNEVIWDFFYEHCSLFSASSLALAFRVAGFRVDAVRKLFGDQYLWLEASPDGDNGYAAPAGRDAAAMTAGFAQRFNLAVARWADKVAGLRAGGRVAIWGAGAKGATFVDLVDRDRTRIDCVVDINPNKHGRYIAGTGHPIVPPRALLERGVSAAIMMNPNYLAEAQVILDREGIRTRLSI